MAARSGASPATVSRVLNGCDTVAAELRDRVRAAVDALGYRPYGPARALRQRLTRVWMAVVADIEIPFFTAVVRVAEDEAVHAGHQVILCNSDEDLHKESTEPREFLVSGQTFDHQEAVLLELFDVLGRWEDIETGRRWRAKAMSGHGVLLPSAGEIRGSRGGGGPRCAPGVSAVYSL